MIVTNADKIDDKKLEFATRVMTELQSELHGQIERGYGPFLAAIYQGNKMIVKCANSVVMDKCSNHHAEVNVIRAAQEFFGTYDLSQYNLDLYSTAEPCMMCLGAIMWSGIKSVIYGVPTSIVESVTGFDEGFKTGWLDEFEKRGITVYGNIEPDLGEKVLRGYMVKKHIVYKPNK